MNRVKEDEIVKRFEKDFNNMFMSYRGLDFSHRMFYKILMIVLNMIIPSVVERE